MAQPTTSVSALFARLRESQQKRPGLYRKFEACFKEYLEQSDARKYEQVVKEITEEFVTISTAIREVEQAFRDMQMENVANLIRKLQLYEKENLQVTSQLQIERKTHQEKKDSYQAFEEAEYEVRVQALREQLILTLENINDTLEELKYAEAEYCSPK